MVSEAPAKSEVRGAPGKRLLFSKPSWSKSQNLGSSELFHRSEQVYVASSTEFERKRRERKAKKKIDQVPKEANAERATKRQRIIEAEDEDDDNDDEKGDDEDDDKLEGRDDSGGHDREHSSGIANARCAPFTMTASDTMRKDSLQAGSIRPLTRDERCRPFVSTVTDLDEDDDPDKASDSSIMKVETLRMTAELERDDVTGYDDEFPELARKAREKARKRQHEEGLPAQKTSPLYFAEHKPSSLSPPTAPSSPDPTLQILITSSIPNTTPLIVSRKLSQLLKDVRLAWVDRQQFSSDFKKQVFLTWREKRLFDVTTCKSLGIGVDSEGRVIAKGDVLGNEEGRIHMEAMTSEILDSRKKAKIEENENYMGASDLLGQTEKKFDNQIRIILKAKGFEDFKLIVKATTLISKILNAFRQANGVDLERDVYIMFEGQRLEPRSSIEDAEIADFDALDIYVK